MPSTTIHRYASDGSSIKRGTSTIANDGTIVTGLSQVDGFRAKAKDADVVVKMTSQSAGTATVSVVAAGVALKREKNILLKTRGYKRGLKKKEGKKKQNTNFSQIYCA